MSPILGDCLQEQAVGVDIETCKRRMLDVEYDPLIFKPGLDPYLSEIRLIQIATSKCTYVIDLFHVGAEAFSSIMRPLFEGDNTLKIFHNAKFDVKMMMYLLGWYDIKRICCTMLISQVLSNGITMHKRKHSLKEAALRYLKIELDKEEQTSDWGTWELTEEQVLYAAKDAEILLHLCKAQMKYVRNDRMGLDLRQIIKIECDCAIAVARMELDGVFVDRELWDDADLELRAKYHELSLELKLALGNEQMNLESPAQVLKELKRLNIMVNGEPIANTNSKYLAPAARHYPVVALLLEHRGVAKLLSSYGNGIPGKKRKKNQIFFLERIHPVTGRIHAEFGQLLTDTGRFNCTKPNLQQLPNMDKVSFRRAFRGREGNSFVVVDMSQFEMRILADLTGDKNLLKAFRMGGDIHIATAALMFDVDPLTIVAGKDAQGEKIKGPNYWMRNAAKSINFGEPIKLAEVKPGQNSGRS